MDYEERVLNGKDVFKSFFNGEDFRSWEREGGRVLGGGIYREAQIYQLGTLNW